MKKLFFICLLMCFFSVFLSAQTAEKLEELLKNPAVSYEQAAWFVLEAADIWDLSNNAAAAGSYEAFVVAMEQEWLPKKAGFDDTARLDGVSLLIMGSFGLKGGIFYSWTKNPHYAYRELVYQDVIQGRADPTMKVSGDTLVFLVSRVLSAIENSEWSPVLSVKPRGLVRGQVTAATAVAAAAAPGSRQNQQLVALADRITAELDLRSVADTTVRITNEGVTISLLNIQFLANSAELADSEKTKLREISQILNSVPNRRILVSGHTALAGTERDRQLTSLQRAQSVKDYLVLIGYRKADEILVQGYGSERPVASNDTPEGMALNRRVEITILEN